MAVNSVIEELVTREFVKHEPSDFMVATFADKEAAREAYDALKTLDHQGQIKLDTAVVLDRDENGKMRVQGAKLPTWTWAAMVSGGLLMLGGVGWLGVFLTNMFRERRQTSWWQRIPGVSS